MRLSTTHKVFIVERLASFEAPADVRRAFQARFGKAISLSQIVYYDPASAQGSRELAGKWKTLFDETRKAFIEETAGIAIAHKAYRLRRLDENERQARKVGNIVLSNSCLEQAAREVGGMFTNRRSVDVTSHGEQITGVVFMAPGEDTSIADPPHSAQNVHD